MSPYMFHAQMHHAFPFGGLLLMIAVWIVQLIIAYFIWKDAKEQKMLHRSGSSLRSCPCSGLLVDVLYLIIRENTPSPEDRKILPCPS